MSRHFKGITCCSDEACLCSVVFWIMKRTMSRYPPATATGNTVCQASSESLPHEAVDDEVGGAVEDEHEVVDVVGDDEPRWIVRNHVLLFTIQGLVQYMDLQNYCHP